MKKIKISDRSLAVLRILIPMMIILISCIRLVVIFSFRDGHHVDETFSYGFANSYYRTPDLAGYFEEKEPFIGTWITGDFLNDYLTVDSDHRFSYDSVLYNKKDDLCPPLHAFLLHTICSFFPNSFSWFFSFALNLILFVPVLVLIYAISHDFTKSSFCGWLSMLFYAFSGCGTANFLYLRVYSLFTLMTLLTFWLLTRVLKSNKNSNIKRKVFNYAVLITVTFLGALSHFYFLVIAFFFTLFGAVYLLFAKRIKECILLCSSMLSAVVLFFLIYRPALNILMPFFNGKTAAGGGISFPYHMDLAVANVRFFKGSIGWYIPFSVANLMYVGGAIVFLAICFLLVRFLFRNEESFKNVSSKAKSALLNLLNIFRLFLKKLQASILIALLSVIAYILIIPYTASLTNMGFVERYFFPAMTIFIIVFISFIGLIIKNVYECHSVSSIIVDLVLLSALILMVMCSDKYTYMFRFEDMNESDIKSAVDGRDCYVIINSSRDLVWLTPMLNSANNIYVEYQNAFNADDTFVPALDKDDVLLMARSDLLTDEEKEQLLSNPDAYNTVVESYGSNKTAAEIINYIELYTGNHYESQNGYKTFIGDLGIYYATDY